MKNRAMWLIAVAVMLLGLSPAKAVTLSDKLSENLLDYDYVYYDTGSPSGISEHWTASSFTTGTSSWPLQSVTLSLRERPGQTLGTNALVDIYTDNSGQPGTSIGSLTSYSPTPIGTAGEYTFTDGGISLWAGNTYWVVLKALADGNAYDAGVTDSTAGPGGTFLPTFMIYDTGTGWTDIPGLTLLRQVTTIIPEPSTVALFGTALLLLGLSYRRQAGNIA